MSLCRMSRRVPPTLLIVHRSSRVATSWQTGPMRGWRAFPLTTTNVLAAAVLLGAVVLLPGLVTTPEWFTAYATGIQAAGVIAALAYAARSLHADNHDRRVDRVLDLHEMLISGDINDARARLVQHLRSLGVDGRARTVRVAQLEQDRGLSTYRRPEDAPHQPSRDLALILRFFERANGARTAGSTYEPLFHQLIAGHAGWWDLAIVEDPSRVDSRPLGALRDLARWGNDYAANSTPGWGTTRARDFGGTVAVESTEKCEAEPA